MFNVILVKAQSEFIPGDILVQVEHQFSPEQILKDLAFYNGIETKITIARDVSPPWRIWLLNFDSGVVPQSEMLAAVNAHPGIAMAQNNYLIHYRATIPNDPNFGNQWHHVNSNDADIDSDLAWDITTGGYTAHGDTIVVCVIENSDLPHPDLINNAWFNDREIPNDGIDNDNNGYVDDHEGWNPVANNDAVYGGSHGTQVSGMIGAQGDNNLGVAGANWAVKIMLVTVGSLTDANVVESYTYPWTMRRLYNLSNGTSGAFVVSTNASWGLDGEDPSLHPVWCAVYDSLGTVGILNCGATANNSVDIDVVGDMPTACASEFMVSVTATNNQDLRTFSAWGLTTIDVGAPGAGVWTTNIGGGYGSTSGTSFASPLTAGVIGLLYSVPCSSLMDLVTSDPEAGALYVRDALFNGVDQVGNLPGATVTGGRINSFNSIMEIMNNCGVCPEANNLMAVWTSISDILVTWDTVGVGPYNIRYKDVNSTIWITETGIPTNSHLITGVTPCMDYEIQVEVICDSIESGFSQSVIITAPTEPMPLIDLDNDQIICDGDIVMLSSSADNNIWSTGDTTQSITVTSTGNYFVTGVGSCNSENSDTTEILVIPVPAQPLSNDEFLPSSGVATLSATGDSVLWYDVSVGGQVIGTGNIWDTPFLDQTTDFWCSDVNAINGSSTLCESPRTQVTVIVNSVGMEEQDYVGQINVYPSPANNEVNFDLSAVVDRSDLVIKVLDLNGKLVESKTVFGPIEIIGTSGLADGLYHFNIERNSSVLGSGRFTVVH